MKKVFVTYDSRTQVGTLNISVCFARSPSKEAFQSAFNYIKSLEGSDEEAKEFATKCYDYITPMKAVEEVKNLANNFDWQKEINKALKK